MLRFKLLLREKNNITDGNIKIYPDKTKIEQLHLKILNEELKIRQKNGEDNLIIKYKNGYPKIIKAPKNYKIQ